MQPPTVGAETNSYIVPHTPLKLQALPQKFPRAKAQIGWRKLWLKIVQCAQLSTGASADALRSFCSHLLPYPTAGESRLLL